MNHPLPPFEGRLQRRYSKLVAAHCAAAQAVAAGIHAVPGAGSALSAAQAAWRFFHNERVSLRALAAPLIEMAQAEVPRTCDQYVLAIHDWSELGYPRDHEKLDRLLRSGTTIPVGYELLTTLLVSDRDGQPIGPVALSLQAADGVHCSRAWKVREPASRLDELDPAMTHVERLSLGATVVHVVDAEADSVAHYRLWSTRPGRQYLVRADDRLAQYEEREQKFSAIQAALQQRGQFQQSRDVVYRGRPAQQWVAEASIVLTRAGQRNRPNRHDRQRVPGPPLPLRLVIAEVRSHTGELWATWFLLTNLSLEVDAATIALWYYWRWSIEGCFKLLKSAGLQLEQWQQTTAAAIARRLLVAYMACVLVWRLAHSNDPAAAPVRELLCKLSGRQIRRRPGYTIPAMLAGLWVLLAIRHVLDHYRIEDLRQTAQALDHHPP